MTQPSNVRLVTEATLPTLATPKISVAATVTSSATLVANKDTPVNATAGPVTMTLPTNAAAGAMLAVEKIDASANAVTISGTMRGVASSQIPLTSQYEARVFLSEGSGSWRPLSDHRTNASLTAVFAGRLEPASYTYNTDGTVATETVGGLTTTYAYNSDGTVHTATRNGVTLTYTYDANLNVTAVA